MLYLREIKGKHVDVFCRKLKIPLRFWMKSHMAEIVDEDVSPYWKINGMTTLHVRAYLKDGVKEYYIAEDREEISMQETIISLRVSDEIKKAIRMAAAENNDNIQTWMRKVVIAALTNHAAKNN